MVVSPWSELPGTLPVEMGQYGRKVERDGGCLGQLAGAIEIRAEHDCASGLCCGVLWIVKRQLANDESL